MATEKFKIKVETELKQSLQALKKLQKAYDKLEKELKETKKALKAIGKKFDDTEKKTNRLRISTSGLRRTLGSVRNNLLLVTFATAGMVSVVKKATDAFARQELAEKKLSSALGFTSDALIIQATNLQKLTSFGDENIIEAQAMIAAFTKEEDEIKLLTQATLDLSAAKGLDLVTAADLVAKSFGSSTNALSRYGVQTEGAAGSTERLEQLTQGITTLFGGQAEAQARTFAGSISQMKNASGDASEALGAVLAPTVSNLARVLKSAAERASKFFRRLTETALESRIRELKEMGAETLNYEIRVSKAALATLKLQALKKIPAGLDEAQINKQLEESQGRQIAATEKNLGLHLELNKNNTSIEEIQESIVNKNITLSLGMRGLGREVFNQTKQEKEKLEVIQSTFDETNKQIVAEETQTELLTGYLKMLKEVELTEKQLVALQATGKKPSAPTEDILSAYEEWLEKLKEKNLADQLETENIETLIHTDEKLARSLGLLPPTYEDWLTKLQEKDAADELELKHIGQLIAADFELAKSLGLVFEGYEKLQKRKFRVDAPELAEIEKVDVPELGDAPENIIGFFEGLDVAILNADETSSEFWANLTEGMQNGLSTTQAFVDAGSDLFNNMYAHKKQLLDNDMNAEIQAVEQSLLSAETKQARIANIKEKYRKKDIEARKSLKPIKYAQAISNTALAVTDALDAANPPFNFILAGLVAAAGAAEVATISAQPFHSGGLVGGQGDTPIMAQSGEFVLSRNAVQSIGVDSASRINEGGGAGITVNITAPLVDETVRDSILPAIREAERFELA